MEPSRPDTNPFRVKWTTENEDIAEIIDDDDLDDIPHPLANVIANKLYSRDVRDILTGDATVQMNITEVSF